MVITGNRLARGVGAGAIGAQGELDRSAGCQAFLA